MKEPLVQITFTTGSLDEARKIARLLVKDNKVACAQIIPWIESIYLWNHNLETTQESKVLLKARRDHLDEIVAVILANNSYELPEILWGPIEEGHGPFLEWVATNR